MKKVILTYGTFDLFHIGHLKLLQRLKKLGDYLIVGVSTDEFNNLKGTLPIAEKLASEVLSLPIYPYISYEDLRVIVDAINKY